METQVTTNKTETATKGARVPNHYVKEWITRTGRKEVIRILGDKKLYVYIYSLGNGLYECDAKRAVQIERATGGKLSREKLRPRDWFDIWPELVNMQDEKKAAAEDVDEPAEEEAAAEKF